MLERIKGLAVELEATYNTDPVVDPASDAILTRGLTVSPLDGDFINRDNDRATLGAEGDILVSSRVLMSFEVEAAGSGAAGTAPVWEDLLRGVGYGAEVNSPGVSSTYDLVSTALCNGFAMARFIPRTQGARLVSNGPGSALPFGSSLFASAHWLGVRSGGGRIRAAAFNSSAEIRESVCKVVTYASVFIE